MRPQVPDLIMLNVASITWVNDVLICLILDMLSTGVCTTSLCQTPGRLMQELDVCTVKLSAKPTARVVLSQIKQPAQDTLDLHTIEAAPKE